MNDASLWSWRKRVLDGSSSARAAPSPWLDGKGTEVTVEELEIAYERFELG